MELRSRGELKSNVALSYMTSALMEEGSSTTLNLPTNSYKDFDKKEGFYRDRLTYVVHGLVKFVPALA